MNERNCATELEQLAHLLKTCADMAKTIAWSTPKHSKLLSSVATGADRMAMLVENIES